MMTLRQVFLWPLVVGGLCLLSGCASGPTVVPAPQFDSAMAFDAGRAPTQFDASATIAVSATMTQEMRRAWQTQCKSAAPADNYLQAAQDVLVRAIAASGLFARIVPAGQARPDFLVNVSLEEHAQFIDDSGHSGFHQFRLKLTLELTDARTGKEISSHSGETSLGFGSSQAGAGYYYETNRFQAGDFTGIASEATRAALQEMLPHLEGSLADALRYRMQQPERDQLAAAIRAAALPDLLAARDPTADQAQERNHALVAAKIKQLPGLLRDDRTEALTALEVRIEQTILDLDHECAMDNDRAQRIAATSGDAAQIDQLRGLAICYRERIELLKPIVAAIKEELANRNR